MSDAPEVVKPYDQNPDLVKMRQDIADRSYNIKIKSWIVTGISVALGLGVGALLMGTLGPIALIGGAAVGMMVGGPIADALTMKDQKKLEIDESMVNSYMQGKNYWGEGYRKEVAEYGYGGEQVAAPRNNLPKGNPPQPRNTPQGR